MALSIFDAASAGDETYILSVMNPHRRELRRDQSGNTALYLAAGSSHANIVKLLLKLGTDPNARNKSRETALHAAARANSPDIVDLLLGAGTAPQLKSSEGLSALDVAVEGDCLDVVELMLKTLPPVMSHEAMRIAVRRGNSAVLGEFENSLKNRPGQSTSLFYALHKQDEASAKYILHSGVNPNIRDQRHITPLHIAASKGNAKLVQLLLDAGAKHSVKDRMGGTPLFAAIQSQDVNSAKLLLDAGADVNMLLVQGELRRPLLHCLAQYELPEIAKMVLDRGVDSNALDELGGQACRWAAQNGNLETLKVLHSAGCDILAPNNEGSTPLLMAALKDRVPVVQYLLNAGADYNTQDVNNNTPLRSAVQGYSLASAKLLCEHGAKVTLVDIHNAASRGHYDLVRLMLPFAEEDTHAINFDWARVAKSANQEDIKEFLRVGIPVKELGKKELKDTIFQAILKEQYELVAAIIAKHEATDIVEDVSLMNPLHVAAEVGNLQIFNLLVEKGFSINKQTQYGQTILHLAARRGHGNIIRQLRGVLSTEIIDENGQTPLHWAATAGHADVVELLIQFGSNMDRRDTDGRTALGLAAWNGHVAASSALIKAGASPAVASRPLATPLHSAALKSSEIVKLLLETERVDVDALNASGLTPLHCASSAEIAQLLLQHGADVYRTSLRGPPAVLFAAEAGRHDVLAMLLPKSPKWLSNQRNKTKLWIPACQNEHHNAFQTLLDFGLKLDDLDSSMLIPMATEAALNGNDKTLAVLVDYMLAKDILTEPSLAFRILMLAVEGSCVESTRALAALRGIQEYDTTGWKPLLLAAKAGNRDLVEALLEGGADPEYEEPANRLSAHRLAAAEKHQDVIETLELYIATQGLRRK